MAVVITTTGAAPTVGASFDVWGGQLNANIGTVKTDLDALASQVNTDSPLAAAALSRAGGTMTGDQVLADVAPGSILSAGFRGVPVVTIDADRTFLNTDAGKCVRLSGVTARTWTIPAGVHPIGTAIMIRSASSGLLSIARAGGVVLRVDGNSADANRTLAPFGRAVLYQDDSNQWTASGTGLS